MKLKYGIGINDKKHYWNSKEYFLWSDMIRRCYSSRYHAKKPTYIGCSVSDNFKYFSYFYDWCQSQIGFKNDGWCLDKDILIKNNKIYSEDNCIFIPNEINTLICKCDGARGDYPLDVYFHKRIGRFASKISKNKKRKHLGYFNSADDAFMAYKVAKELHIKEVAQLYSKDIDPRAYRALMNYNVDIRD